jgi:hypothetical protein
LVCSLSAQSPTWDKASPVEISIVIENRSDNALRMKMGRSLSLTPADLTEEPQKSELSYVALMDLPAPRSLAVSRAVPLRLGAHGREEVTVGIARLLWTRVNWSVLPHSTLFEVVPSGKYLLQFTITAHNEKDGCSSNALAVEIK